MNSIWDIRIFLGLVPKESHCINLRIFLYSSVLYCLCQLSKLLFLLLLLLWVVLCISTMFVDFVVYILPIQSVLCSVCKGYTGILKPGFRVTPSLTIKETLQSVRVEFPCRHCRRQTWGTLLSSATSGWGCLPNSYETFFQSCCRMWISRRIRAWFMHDGAPQHFVLAVGTFLNNFFPEHCVDQPRGLLSPWFMSLIFFISGDICLCYRRRWYLGLARNTEWIWGDWFDTRFFPASQAVIAQTCNILHWSWRWTVWTFSLFFLMPLTLKPCLIRPMFIEHFSLVLWYRFIFIRFDRAFIAAGQFESFGLHHERRLFSQTHTHTHTM